MKTRYLAYLLLFAIGTSLNAQKKSKQVDDWKQGWTAFDPNQIEYPEGETILEGFIKEDLHLSRFTTYVLSGDVYVTNGAKLSIGAGTVIRCSSDKPGNLIITKGSKFVAMGSQRIPIIFTSDKPAGQRTPGDWGGIYVLGSGTVSSQNTATNQLDQLLLEYNAFGGDHRTEETVIMKYVRLEYGGKRLTSDTDGSSLTLCALGSSSNLENISVSFSENDSYTLYGGDGYYSKLISYKTGDDDFQVMNGFKGGIKKGLVLRDPGVITSGNSYAIEAVGVLEDQEKEKPGTTEFAFFRDIIFASMHEDSNADQIHPLVFLKNLGKIHIYDSTVSGFSGIVAFDDSFVSENQIRKSFTINNSLININNEGLILPNTIEPTYLQSIVMYNKYTNNFIGFSRLFKNTLLEDLPYFRLDEEYIESARITEN